MFKSVLFVCTGNTCRSPMAEGLFKKSLQDNNKKDITVKSAGVMAADGIPATTGAILTMSEMGVDISSHKSTKLHSVLIKESDLILVMERYHKDALLRLDPKIENKVKLLKEYSNASPVELDIADPLGSPLDVYRTCAQEIQGCILKLVNKMDEEKKR